MTAKSPFSGLLVAELAAAFAPLQAALTNISTGDGSLASVTGALVELRGQFIAALPILQKIGVATLAADINQQITDFLAKQAASAGENPAPAPAPEPAVKLVEKLADEPKAEEEVTA